MDMQSPNPGQDIELGRIINGNTKRGSPGATTLVDSCKVEEVELAS
jgi:hypothetical protein